MATKSDVDLIFREVVSAQGSWRGLAALPSCTAPHRTADVLSIGFQRSPTALLERTFNFRSEDFYFRSYFDSLDLDVVIEPDRHAERLSSR